MRTIEEEIKYLDSLEGEAYAMEGCKYFASLENEQLRTEFYDKATFELLYFIQKGFSSQGREDMVLLINSMLEFFGDKKQFEEVGFTIETETLSTSIEELLGKIDLGCLYSLSDEQKDRLDKFYKQSYEIVIEEILYNYNSRLSDIFLGKRDDNVFKIWAPAVVFFSKPDDLAVSYLRDRYRASFSNLDLLRYGFTNIDLLSRGSRRANVNECLFFDFNDSGHYSKLLEKGYSLYVDVDIEKAKRLIR